MTQPDAEVRALLEQRLAAIASVPPIAWENTDFAPPDAETGYWLKPALVWGSQSTEALFGQGSQAVVDNGRFVVSCYGPQDIGAAGLDALVAKVRAQFKPGTQLAGSNVKVLVSAANRGPGLQTGQNEPPFYQVPVTVAFTAWYAA